MSWYCFSGTLELHPTPIAQYKFQLNFTGIISSINIVQHSCSMALTDFPYNILLFFPEVLYSEIKRTSLIFFVKLQFQPFRWRLLQFKLLSSNILCRLVLTLNSPGTQYAQQSYKVSDSFPFKWINKKWREGFYVTAMATAGSRWAVVMSRNAGFTAQVVELDFLYPSEGIHRRWDNGFRITSTAATWDQAAFILSIPKRKPADETQETLRTSAFPSQHVKDKWAKNLYLASICYGRTVS